MKQILLQTNDSAGYCRAVLKQVPLTQRKRLAASLRHDLAEYIEHHPDATMTELEDHFGAPAQFANDYMAASTDRPIKQRASARRYLCIACIVLALTAVIIGACAIIRAHHLAQPDIDLPLPPSSEVSLP